MPKGITVVVEFGHIVIEDRPMKSLPDVSLADDAGQVRLGVQAKRSGVRKILLVREGVEIFKVRDERGALPLRQEYIDISRRGLPKEAKRVAEWRPRKFRCRLGIEPPHKGSAEPPALPRFSPDASRAVQCKLAVSPRSLSRIVR